MKHNICVWIIALLPSQRESFHTNWFNELYFIAAIVCTETCTVYSHNTHCTWRTAVNNIVSHTSILCARTQNSFSCSSCKVLQCKVEISLHYIHNFASQFHCQRTNLLCLFFRLRCEQTHSHINAHSSSTSNICNFRGHCTFDSVVRPIL